MEVRLLFVPPGGGETAYSLEVDLPSIPQPGDYISIFTPEDQGTADFIVRRTRWYLNRVHDSARGSVEQIYVEGEFAKGPTSSERHLHSYRTYHEQTGEERRFEESGY